MPLPIQSPLSPGGTGGECVVPTPPAALGDWTVEQILVSGGDSRLDIDRLSGLSRYGCAGHPRDTLPLGSCSASSPSPRGLEAAYQEVAALRNVDDAYRQVRSAIADQLLIGPDLGRVVLTPSGTDAELVALALVFDGGPITNVIVGPTEVGSGTVLAAGGRYFDTKLPSGNTAIVGAAVDETLVAATRVRLVNIRNRANGALLRPSSIDGRVTDLVDREVSAGRRVLLHLVEHSKTGLQSPTPSTVERLCARHGDRIAVLIDAAQGRVSRSAIADALRRGNLVLITGSKFYGGPPFSGALLIPRSFNPPDLLAAGLEQYISRGCLPEDWEIRDQLNSAPNLGLLARWFAALSEMRSYYEIPSGVRLRAMTFWETRVQHHLSASPWVRLLPIRRPETVKTICTFQLTAPGRNGDFLNYVELQHFCHLLNQSGFHVGQPVKLCSGLGETGPCALRVALGAQLIGRLMPDGGETLQDRLEWLDGQLANLRREIDRLAEEEFSRSDKKTRETEEKTNEQSQRL